MRRINGLPAPGQLIRVRHIADGREVVGRVRADESGEPITRPQTSGDVIARFEVEGTDRRTWILWVDDPARVEYVEEEEAPAAPALPVEEAPAAPQDPARDLNTVARAALRLARQSTTGLTRPEAPNAAPTDAPPVATVQPLSDTAIRDRIGALRAIGASAEAITYRLEQLRSTDPTVRYGPSWDDLQATAPEPEPEQMPEPEPASEPEPQGNDLRPQTLDEYDVGQDHLIRNLQVAVAATLRQDRPLPHVLLDGPPGLGKTTLAYVLANELGTDMHPTSGPAIDDPQALLGLLDNLQRGDVLFIDEAHRLPHYVAEYLYQALEDFRIDWIEGTGADATTQVREVAPFTMIAATTNSGAMPRPLRDRCGLHFHLTFYTPAQLARIADRSARILGLRLAPEAALLLADRARGTARIVNRLLQRAADWALVMEDGLLTVALAEEALLSLGIDHLGLTPLDRRYLRVLLNFYGGGPAGVNALAAALGDEKDNIQEVIEPYLLMKGLIARTSRGRIMTDRGKDHILEVTFE